MATTTVISTEKYGAIHWRCFARGCCCTMLSTTVHSSPAGVEWSILVGISLDSPIITAILLSSYNAYLSSCYPAAILIYFNLATLLSCYPTILQACYLSSSYLAIWLPCYLVILLSWYPSILPSSYPAILLSNYRSILLPRYLAIVKFRYPISCYPVLHLSYFPAIAGFRCTVSYSPLYVKRNEGCPGGHVTCLINNRFLIVIFVGIILLPILGVLATKNNSDYRLVPTSGTTSQTCLSHV